MPCDIGRARSLRGPFASRFASRNEAKTPKVVHFKKAAPGSFVYVGRPSDWGNPFSHKAGTLARFQVGSVEEAVAAFDKWLDAQPSLLRRIADGELTDKDLACWGCNPCHAQVLLRRANPWLFS